ncbi:MAG TPA: lysophospholipid acyltransferase family protein [Gaiellales bacterium]|jgi:1-acyl-sn-glycerol-3-phosphate acyltransferase|nr:lysophospholipid acyltransferase family protein [Gaiellales bacterium]
MASTPAEEEGGQKPLSLPRYRPWFYDLVRIASATFLLPFRLTASGIENVPTEGGVVLAPMHRSYVDSLAVGVPLKQRQFRAMAKYELFLVPVVGRAIALGGGFPVRRGVQDMEAYEAALALLRGGDMLLVFPEGTRNRDGSARPQLGAARLALEAAVALVPVSISGSDRIKLLPPRFPRIHVHYGEPIPLDDLPLDDLRRSSYTATKRWSAAIDAGLTASPS